jgi:zinc/manganese transport system substrate-binding protein
MPEIGQVQVARRWLISLGLCLSLFACGTASNEPDDDLLIVATTSILGDIAAAVAGDEAQVEVLIPIGVDAHDFSPSGRQAGLIAEADLVIANGLGLEAGLGDVLQNAAGDGVEVLEVAPMVDPLSLSGDDTSLDPHFWMDPLRAGEAARLVAGALSTMTPGGWDGRADAYAAGMETTDSTISETLSAISRADRQMVTSHESFGYFADRYDFEILGVIVPGGSTLTEPSSAHVADLVAVMEEADSNVIFAETTEPTALAEAIASELGSEAQVVELYTESLGEPGSEADTLPEMLITNARRISEALP